MFTVYCMDIVPNCHWDNGIIEHSEKKNIEHIFEKIINCIDLTQNKYHIRNWNWNCAHDKKDKLLFTLWSEMWNMISLSLQMYCFSCVWCTYWYHSFISHYQQSCDHTSVWICLYLFILLQFIFPTRFLLATPFSIFSLGFTYIVCVALVFSWHSIAFAFYYR